MDDVNEQVAEQKRWEEDQEKAKQVTQTASDSSQCQQNLDDVNEQVAEEKRWEEDQEKAKQVTQTASDSSRLLMSKSRPTGFG